MSKSDIIEYREQGIYENARADQCNTIISMFERELPEHIIKWLQEQRTYHRERGINDLTKSIAAYNESQE